MQAPRFIVDPAVVGLSWSRSGSSGDGSTSRRTCCLAVVGLPAVVLAAVGVADGLPGVAVGPAVMGKPVVELAVLGAPVMGVADGLPGVVVGPVTVGLPVVGLAIVGVADGLPGVTMGPAVMGAPVL